MNFLIGEKSRKAAQTYRRRLKAVYFAFLIGFLLTSVSKRFIAAAVDEGSKAYFDYHVYFVFEHYVRTILIALGGYYTIRLAIALRGSASTFRFVSMISFVGSTVVFMAGIPTLFAYTGDHFMGLSYLFMPFPWLSSVLHVPLTGETYRSSFTAVFGDSGVQVAVLAYLGFQLYAFVPTLFYGRRWFCSMACIFAGGHAETLGDVLPLVPHNRKRRKSKIVHPAVQKILKGILVIEIAVTLFVHTGLLVWVAGGNFPLPVESLLGIEVTRFLILDTFLLNFLWWLVGGRFYCYYCAPGFLLGALGRAVGQRIATDGTDCNGCKLCNEACKMSIDVMSRAEASEPVKTVYCVGCGQCVDVCPKDCLAYRTGFTSLLREKGIIREGERGAR